MVIFPQDVAKRDSFPVERWITFSDTRGTGA